MNMKYKYISMCVDIMKQLQIFFFYQEMEFLKGETIERSVEGY